MHIFCLILQDQIIQFSTATVCCGNIIYNMLFLIAVPCVVASCITKILELSQEPNIVLDADSTYANMHVSSASKLSCARQLAHQSIAKIEFTCSRIQRAPSPCRAAAFTNCRRLVDLAASFDINPRSVGCVRHSEPIILMFESYALAIMESLSSLKNILVGHTSQHLVELSSLLSSYLYGVLFLYYHVP